MPIKTTQQSKSQNIPKLRFPGFSGGWEREKLGEFCEFLQGVQVDVDLQLKEPKEGYEKFLRIENYTQNSNDFRYVPKEVSRGKKIDINDVVAVRYGATAGFISKGFQGVLANNLFTITPKNKDQLSKDFLFKILKQERVFKYLQAAMSGGAMPALSFSIMNPIKISFPSLPEQQKIASFLGAVDEWIQNLRKQKESLEKYKKGMMQKIFSQKIRFPGFSGEWEEKKVGDVFEVTRGYVLAVKDMKVEQDEKYPFPVYSSQTRNKGLIGFYKDFLYEDAITWTTDGANAGDVNFRKGKFYCTNVCGVLLNKQGYANEFMAEALNAVTKKYVSYVGNPKLMNNVMAKIKMQIPTIAEQQKIADFLTSVDDLISLKEKQISQAESWKKGLMQGLFV